MSSTLRDKDVGMKQGLRPGHCKASGPRQSQAAGLQLGASFSLWGVRTEFMKCPRKSRMLGDHAQVLLVCGHTLSL